MLVYAEVVAFLFASVVVASPTPRVLAVHGHRASAPRSFVSTGVPNPSKVLNLKLGLTANNRSGLEQTLLEVSTPGSNRYGQHLSLDEVKSFMAPTSEASSAVLQWLSDNGINGTTAGAYDHWIDVSIPVSKANSLLGANFQTFVHSPSGVSSVRTLSYQIPKDLFAYIDTVHPTTSFVKPFVEPVFSFPVSKARKNNTSTAGPSQCQTSGVTPACIQALYGVPTTPASQTSNILGVSGFIEQFAQTADLSKFLQKFRPDISSKTSFDVQTFDGGSNPQGNDQAGIEANLDIQYTVGIATNVPVVFLSVGEENNDGANGFLDLVNALADQPPNVLSTSYGFDEGDLSPELEQKICDAYMALGAQGTSILFSSGDGGVGGSQAQQCSVFIPTFPSGCPYVTSVGATTGFGPEVAADFSSGGFSNTFPQASFQTDAVSAYLTALGTKNKNKFNATGRGFPDVSVQGQQVLIVTSGKQSAVDGTSCSTPMFASMISLLNDQLISAGKSPLGFLNPFLYSNPSMFTDVTQGSNPGCSTDGFPAAAGWDPVTGLGTPIFSAMAKAAGL